MEVTLGESGISYRGKKGTIEMPYEAITGFRYPSVRYLGGWIKIVSGSDTIRLTVVVENIGEFVRELKEQMDHCELSSRYDRAKFFRFYKTAAYADQSWARIYANFGPGVGLIIIAAAAGWLAAIVDDAKAFSTALWVGGAVIWFLLVYLFVELELIRRLARNSDETNFTVPDRDPQVERSLFVKAFAVGGILFVAGAILIGSMT